MKKVLFIPVFLFMFSAGYAQTENEKTNQAAAVVQNLDGFLFFIASAPVSKYERIGFIKLGATWSGQPHQRLNNIIKQARKEYPRGQGIIIDYNYTEAEIIIFKE